MVSINGHEVINHAVDLLRTGYNHFFGKPAGLGRSSSFVRQDPKRPAPKVAARPLKKTRSHIASNGPAPKGRKQGRVTRKRYNELARENTITLYVPGAFPKDPLKKEKAQRVKKRGPKDDYEPIDCDPESADEAQTGLAGQVKPGQWPNFKDATQEQAVIMRELNALMSDKFKREGEIEVKKISERMKQQAAARNARLEKEARETEKLRKMRELEEREERERADRWKDQRLAQLERDKHVAQTELAREKVGRKHSKLQRVFDVQRERRETEERWKQLVEEDAKSAAEREENLLRENVELRNNLQLTDDAFRRAYNERERFKQEGEEERTKRLRAEENLYKWKELMNKYFPGGQQPQQFAVQPREQLRVVTPQAQFELYEKKWEVLRSGIDIDGTKVHLISFSQIPWPVINMTPTHPSQIRPEHVQQFLMHPHRVRPNSQGKRKNKKARAMDELRKWHSDKFDQIVLSKVREEDQPAAAAVGGMVARFLTGILN
jgi:hypothetical protein